ncbi:SDR family NAD(P)-dependent oxidoreductase, partial [Domibacillus sp. 8LH]|uniref:SDR family NAD(P)-dependent oxidoreductase n=1 Tax=Domibacillus sp. 8LH TaxID=3073900 RepID=UPI0031710BE8
VTGGAGFIGSHTCIELLQAGFEIIVLDNLRNSNSKSLEVIEKVTGKKVTFFQTDIRDEEALNTIFSQYKFDGVIHFAGLKAVGESST